MAHFMIAHREHSDQCITWCYGRVIYLLSGIANYRIDGAARQIYTQQIENLFILMVVNHKNDLATLIIGRYRQHLVQRRAVIIETVDYLRFLIIDVVHTYFIVNLAHI